MVVRRGYLHHVGADQVEPSQPAQDAEQLPRGETAGFRRPGTGGMGRVEYVDVDRYIERGIADPLADPLDHAGYPDVLELHRPHGTEPQLRVLLEVRLG